MEEKRPMFLRRFRKRRFVSARARNNENKRITTLIYVANAIGIKPRVIVTADTRRAS